LSLKTLMYDINIPEDLSTYIEFDNNIG